MPAQVLAARRGLALPLTAWALARQLARLRIAVLVVTQNKDLALAALAKQLLGGALRLVYQQHVQSWGAPSAAWCTASASGK